MKIIIYDPLYSSMGHFYRYNYFLVRLLNSMDFVRETIIVTGNEELGKLEKEFSKVSTSYLKNEVKSVQEKSMKLKGFAKISLQFKTFQSYRKIISQINSLEGDVVFFSSNGLLSFWLSVMSLKKKYIVSAISTKWINDKGGVRYAQYFLYKKFLLRSLFNLFTEQMYCNKAEGEGIKNGIVFPDRYLESAKERKYGSDNSIIRLVTLGTISSIKSPVPFLKAWQKTDTKILQGFVYGIYGKVMDDSRKELEELTQQCRNVTFCDDYISSAKYDLLMEESDFMVIPYSLDYTKYLTSGVMWDCFQAQKPILCPDIEPFRYYVKKFQIGYLYKENELATTLTHIIKEYPSFKEKLGQNFEELVAEHSFNKLLDRLSQPLKAIYNSHN